MANITENADFNAPVEDIVQLLASKDFAAKISDEAGASLNDFTVEGDVNSNFSITTVRSVSTEQLPDMAKNMVGDALKLTQVENWQAADQNGSRQGTVKVLVDGAPLCVEGTQQLTSNGETSSYVIDATVDCSIPFVGGKIAEAAAPMLKQAFELQVKLMSQSL